MRNEQKNSVRLGTFLSRTLARLQPDQAGHPISPSPVPLRSRRRRRRRAKPKEVNSIEPSQAVAATATDSEASALEISERADPRLLETGSFPSTEPSLSGNSTLAGDHQPVHKSWLSHPWLIALFVSTGTGLSAIIWLSSLPPLPNCQRVSPLATDAERLYCADQTAREGEVKQLTAALEIVSQWPQDHPLFPQASQLRSEWSRSLLSIATQRRDQGKLQEAIAIARQVPPNSSLHSEAQTSIQTWQAAWDQGNALYEQAQAALKTQKWEQVTTQLKLLVKLDNDYWRQRIKELNARVATERSAWNQLQQAENLAQAGTLDGLSEALSLVSQIDRSSYVAASAKAEQEEWSQRLLAIAEELLRGEDWQAAIAAAEKIPPNTSVHAEAQDIVNFGQAQVLSQKDKVWAYLNAWALTRQIQPQQPLYQQAQAKTSDWEQQIQNLTQIGMAKWFASLGASFDQEFGYRLAVDHAALIQADHPRRLRAQTLMAEWGKRLEILADRQYLVRAIQLVGAGTLENLQAAIRAASQVGLGRALRLEAQTLVAHWQDRLQTIEDQPLLEQAKALAQQGQLSEAIQIAEKVGSDRALYYEAQAAIRDWVAQSQSTEDQPILNQARALARQGNLTEAITTASQIGSDRALYYDAQREIGNWIAERDAIEAEPQAVAEPDSLDDSADNDSSGDPALEELPANNSEADERSSAGPETVSPSAENSPTADAPLVDQNFEPVDP